MQLFLEHKSFFDNQNHFQNWNDREVAFCANLRWLCAKLDQGVGGHAFDFDPFAQELLSDNFFAVSVTVRT
jgi:hypothetical protein